MKSQDPDGPVEDGATVLVVDDEADVADTYAEMLADEYTVRTAYGGEEALEVIDGAVDVVLLDRRMPTLPGDEVLARIRDRGLECRIAMVTAVTPDFDVVDLPLDGYVTKPVSRDDLFDLVEALLLLDTYLDLRRELSSKKIRRNVLQVEKEDAELARSGEFATLEDDISELEFRIDEIESKLETVRGTLSAVTS